jgi:hypothetical protein
MQSLNQGESIMEISRKYGISRNTIKKYRNSLSLEGSTVAPIPELSDEQLSDQLQSPVKEEVSSIAFAVAEGLHKIIINPSLITNSGAIKSVSLERFIISKIPFPKRSISPVKNIQLANNGL